MNKKKHGFGSTLHLKFIVVYIIFGFLTIFTTAAINSDFIDDHLIESAANSLYKSANITATEYLSSYFNDQLSNHDVHNQLNGIVSYSDASAWFVDTEGNLISSAHPDNHPAPPLVIEHFDPLEGNGALFLEGSYHDSFNAPVITVMAPVVNGFHTKGYLLLHKYVSDITSVGDILTKRIHVTSLIIYLLSFIILLAFELIIYRPLRVITRAATEYASGNLDYTIPVNTQDEMGYLSASLNYMSSQLKDMEDYQKHFVANVSHDFRSPLTSIKGYVEAIADGTIPPEFQQKYLDIILFETERLTDLTRDLLELNEFDTKNLLLNKTQFDLHEVIKYIAASFEGTCTKKKISIELIFAKKHLNVYADKSKIERVLYNLIDNAIKFSDPDSIVTVETTELGEKVLTSVKDNGIGIPRDALNKIWERFYKTDLSRGKDKKGTGLGLAIVKESIQAHGENINVISTEGVGTEFTFSLPKG
ncbi:MAG: HAMP domain-containing sensor histidine kinase [Eubacteriales bacterium]|nr:HAMP domain-containing sensor histidine kinase [Eubacteriales bacterium]